ncbi:MAG: GtrA family protein [Bacilli bacterium]
MNLYKKHEEIVNYLIIGVLTTVVSLSTYYACVLTFLDSKNSLQLQIANIFSWFLAVAFAYITNRIFVFRSKSKNITKEVYSFVSSRVITLLIDMFTMFVMVTELKISDKISKLIVQVIVILLNYSLSKKYVFKESKTD